MVTGSRLRDWDETAPHGGAAVVQRVEAGLPWEQDAERNRADQDGWLLSFIDVLTLLLTLFVLLLAHQHGAGERAEPVPQQAIAPVPAPMPSGPVPAEPVQEMGAQPRHPSAFTATEDYLALADQWLTQAITPALLQSVRAAVPAAGGGEMAVGVSETAAPEVPALPAAEDPVERLLAELREPALDGRVAVTRQPGGLDLEISDSILFAPASAALTDGGRAVLDELAGLLATLPYALSVEGHTDDRPIATERFPSNWELSSARASGVTRHLIGRGIAADRVRAVGYADTRPLADNASAEGRARNRRVAFILRMPTVGGLANR